MARRAGYSPASRYKHFDGKEDIVAAVAAEALVLEAFVQSLAPGWP